MQWEDLTAPEFAKAVKKAKGVCVLPIGVIEKHGNHLPLGTDLFTARDLAKEAVKKEPAVIFPPYYLTQILEAKPQPGTIAVKGRLMLDLLGEVCSEISRNGLKKILLYNGHGGNNSLLPFFCQLALEEERDYTLYYMNVWSGTENDREIARISKDKYDGHAGESETSIMMTLRPGLVKLSADVPSQGRPQKGLEGLEPLQNAIWWYAQVPHHYRGQARLGTLQKGKVYKDKYVAALVRAIGLVKKDKRAAKFTRKFFSKVNH